MAYAGDNNVIKQQEGAKQKLIQENKNIDNEINQLAQSIQDLLDASAVQQAEHVQQKAREQELTESKKHLDEELKGYENVLQKFTKQHEVMQEESKRCLKIREETENEFTKYQAIIPKLEMYHTKHLQEIENITKATDIELKKIDEEEIALVSPLKMKEKLLQSQIPTLQSSLAQKTQGNVELTNICENLLKNNTKTS